MKYVISLSIMIYFILYIILVLNITDKSKIIKYSFVTFMIVLIVSLFFINEIVMDYIISIVIRYLYYPTFSSVLATVIVSIIVFLHNIISDRKSDILRIMNYTFASFIIIAYIIFLSLNVNLNSYNALYSEDSLLCIRYIARTFVIWIMVVAIYKFYLNLNKKEE